MSKENLKDTMGSLFDGMEGFLTSKTVVGEPIYIKDTIILPLVDVSFGMGAGAFVCPSLMTRTALGVIFPPIPPPLYA